MRPRIFSFDRENDLRAIGRRRLHRERETDDGVEGTDGAGIRGGMEKGGNFLIIEARDDGGGGDAHGNAGGMEDAHGFETLLGR